MTGVQMQGVGLFDREGLTWIMCFIEGRAEYIQHTFASIFLKSR